MAVAVAIIIIMVAVVAQTFQKEEMAVATQAVQVARRI